MLVILIMVSIRLQFVVTDLSGQMLTSDFIWHVEEVLSLQMNTGFHYSGQMAESMCGVTWVNDLLMSM